MSSLSPAQRKSPTKHHAVARLPYGTAILESSLKTKDHGSRTIVGSEPIKEFILPRTSDSRTVRSELRGLLNRVEEFAVDGRFAVGLVTYETMVEVMGLTVREHHQHLPKAIFFGYDKQHDLAPLTLSATQSETLTQSVREQFSRDEYLPRCRTILDLIREGDIYQANLTSRCVIESQHSPETIWKRLTTTNPVPYAAYLSLGDVAVISTSPERFFLRTGDKLLCSPIKGTARLLPDDDVAQIAERLQQSVKNRAELLMIVDLVRNDLGRIAQTGSVVVDDLYKTEPYARLVHLVANVSTSLKAQTSLADIFSAISPGGSITGAPKRRAVEILQEIEATPRGIYTGAIGYVSGARTEFNIAIRTMTWHDEKYELHAGGGIVADSKPEAEFDELLLKASPMLAAFDFGAHKDS